MKNYSTKSKKKTIWVFCFNHGINDQKAINVLVAELLDYIYSYPHPSKVMENQNHTGQVTKEKKALSFPPSMEVALSTDITMTKLFRWALPQIFSGPLKEASYVPSKLTQNYKDDPIKYKHYTDPNKRQSMIECLRLSKEETDALVSVCRSHDVTVTSALSAAMLSICSLFLQNGTVEGGKREELKTQNMKVLLPVCSRKYGVPYGMTQQDSVDNALTEESTATTIETATVHDTSDSDLICSSLSSIAPDSSCNTSHYNSSFSSSVSSIVLRADSCVTSSKNHDSFSSSMSSMDRTDSCVASSKGNNVFFSNVSSIDRGDSCVASSKGINVFSCNLNSIDHDDSCVTSKGNSSFSSSVSSLMRGESGMGKKSFGSKEKKVFLTSSNPVSRVVSRVNSSNNVSRVVSRVNSSNNVSRVVSRVNSSNNISRVVSRTNSCTMNAECATNDWTRGAVVCAAGCIDFVVSVPVSTVIHARDVCESIESGTTPKNENPEFWSLAKECRVHAKEKVEKSLAENLLFFEFLMKQIRLADILNAESSNPNTMGRFSHCGVSNVGVADLAGAVRPGRLGVKGAEITPNLVLKDAYFASGNAYFGFFVTLYAMTVDDRMSMTITFTNPLTSPEDAILFKACLLAILRELLNTTKP